MPVGHCLAWNIHDVFVLYQQLFFFAGRNCLPLLRLKMPDIHFLASLRPILDNEMKESWLAWKLLFLHGLGQFSVDTALGARVNTLQP